MEGLAEYVVDIDGVPHTFLLSVADAERMGAVPVKEKQAPAPLNKARGASTKGA